jgi:hypothetical protein
VKDDERADDGMPRPDAPAARSIGRQVADGEFGAREQQIRKEPGESSMPTMPGMAPGATTSTTPAAKVMTAWTISRMRSVMPYP